ncbi:hypothetical protein CLAFUW4_11956 [Fulvia fulva]|uniref:Uncharacterized protein n=1 Tax=Passalora fulva TaxID=5499 RepID=A0A9Q8PDR8_PASFU|nr:uncharacterized protein CLAFUR5_10998 [Fulvia fulva]KAK4617449.1 hypothetical protein CLAFUR4_11961 [Fulvia fulva]KAK4618512.1 hypothetical protein CLAFUR0_11972 [Fulvia fulva]UJO20646.1 hypothetical protein CLAFUR5_10998 [Fulvia fulva]WPV17902.1 hypothetical protein CLAFUW4_11956 [Fulvia fulva]WPV33348.1 hypothetical protein CLAFUW7_11963 [Fulvia fulva]
MLHIGRRVGEYWFAKLDDDNQFASMSRILAHYLSNARQYDRTCTNSAEQQLEYPITRKSSTLQNDVSYLSRLEAQIALVVA